MVGRYFSIVLVLLGIVLALFIVPAVGPGHPAVAATPPPAISSGVRIDEPKANATVRGVVKIVGTASVPGFARYQIYIKRPTGADFEWKFERQQPVVNGVLWEWNTNPRDYPDGIYVLRLRAVKTDGNYEDYLLTVRVDNATTPTPTTTPTPAYTPTPAFSPTPIVIATPVVIGLVSPTPMPTPRPVASPTPLFGIDLNRLIDPTPWVRAFTTGMVLAGAAVAFVVALFIARALLRWRP